MEVVVSLGGRITPRNVPEYEANAQLPGQKRRGSRKRRGDTAPNDDDVGRAHLTGATPRNTPVDAGDTGDAVGARYRTLTQRGVDKEGRRR